ncbi:MAG: Glutamate carboxypeptidase [Bacteroidetes bacterium]|nr:Glutamate carboxypeptidase [Bacteroidota bacterium]
MFRGVPSADRIGTYIQKLSARPHHVGSAYDKENVEWLTSTFKQWGLDAHIETFNVLFPTPKDRLVELVEPKRFKAILQEQTFSIDPTSGQRNEQLPTYNAYSIDGDVLCT